MSLLLLFQYHFEQSFMTQYLMFACCFVLPQASDLDGEIDLTSCYSVTEYQAQRNYGFQIHVRGFDLSLSFLLCMFIY